MKKLIALILAVVLCLALAGCNSTDYKEAMRLYEAGEYEAAYEIFVALGDYEDSAEKAKDCQYELALQLIARDEFDRAEAILTELGKYKNSPSALKAVNWYRFAACLRQDTAVVITDPEQNYTVTFSAQGNNIYVDYVAESATGNASIHFLATIEKGQDYAQITAMGEFSNEGGIIHDEGTTRWNISDYRAGDKLTWEEYSCTGKKADGTAITIHVDGICKLSADKVLLHMVQAIEAAIEQSGVELSLKDFGFASYQPE